ncbi:30S ribosomal protein S5 [Candidatus Peregrinibacteria bacterium]|nr:30S ribosomal protein S5 [Candidatus Peregrinibacteria bacterium]
MAKRAHRKSKFHKREPKEFEEEVIQIDRVTRVVKGGRKLRFRATVAIGNKKNKVSIGVGKSHEVTGAIKKAIASAKKELIKVPLDGSTIPHDLKIKYKSAKIVFLPAGPGTGIIAGGPIRKVLELAGIKDILSKSFGTNNKLNNSRATYEALKLLRETPVMVKRKKAEAKKASAAQKKATEHNKGANPKAANKKAASKKNTPKKSAPKKAASKKTAHKKTTNSKS